VSVQVAAGAVAVLGGSWVGVAGENLGRRADPESRAVARRASYTDSHRTSDEHGELLWLHRLA